MSNITLNRKLNIVFTIDTEKGPVHVHSTPIGRATFEDNYLVICKAFTQVYSHGLGAMTGPRIAALLLRDEAKKLDMWERTQQSLMAEVYRLTNVIAPGDTGWETYPFIVSKQRGILNEDEAAEVENCIIYFTCASSVRLRAELAVATEGLSTLWGAQTTSSNVTDFQRSLPTWTPEESTGESPKTAVNQ
jgi:hypothetical protein